TLPGMLSLRIDTEGRLEHFLFVPPVHEPARQTDAIDWSHLFAAARLDPAQMQSVSPEWSPLVQADTRAAWTGNYAGRPDLPIRLEAGALHGRPVFFDVIWPWTRPPRTRPTRGTDLGTGAYYVLLALALIGACFLARYNWRTGRGDPMGAAKL